MSQPAPLPPSLPYHPGYPPSATDADLAIGSSPGYYQWCAQYYPWYHAWQWPHGSSMPSLHHAEAYLAAWHEAHAYHRATESDVKWAAQPLLVNHGELATSAEDIATPEEKTLLDREFDDSTKSQQDDPEHAAYERDIKAALQAFFKSEEGAMDFESDEEPLLLLEITPDAANVAPDGSGNADLEPAAAKPALAPDQPPVVEKAKIPAQAKPDNKANSSSAAARKAASRAEAGGKGSKHLKTTSAFSGGHRPNGKREWSEPTASTAGTAGGKCDWNTQSTKDEWANWQANKEKRASHAEWNASAGEGDCIAPAGKDKPRSKGEKPLPPPPPPPPPPPTGPIPDLWYEGERETDSWAGGPDPWSRNNASSGRRVDAGPTQGSGNASQSVSRETREQLTGAAAAAAAVAASATAAASRAVAVVSQKAKGSAAASRGVGWKRRQITIEKQDQWIQHATEKPAYKVASYEHTQCTGTPPAGNMQRKSVTALDAKLKDNMEKRAGKWSEEAGFDDNSRQSAQVGDASVDSTVCLVQTRWQGELSEHDPEWMGLERLRSQRVQILPTKAVDPEPGLEQTHPLPCRLVPPGPPPGQQAGPPSGTLPELPVVVPVAFDSGLSSLARGMKLHAQDTQGNWYLAEVLEVNLEPKAEAPVKVHYMGHAEERWVSIDRLRSKVLRSAASSFDKDTEAELEDVLIGEPVGHQKLMDLSGLGKGLRLQAQADDGIWYLAEVVTVSTMKEREKAPILIHYIGHDCTCDEWVGTQRLRSKALKRAACKAVAGPQEKPDMEWEEDVADFPDLSGLEKGLRLQAKGEDDVWYLAQVVQVATDTTHASAPVLVHYMGYEKEHDEWIGLNRIRSKALKGVPKADSEVEKRAATKLAQDLSVLDVGLRLQAKGVDDIWYVAEVRSVSTSKMHAKAPVLVHYIGHGREMDEWLGPERLRSKALKAIISRNERDVEKASASTGGESFNLEPGANPEWDNEALRRSSQIWKPTEVAPASFMEEESLSEKKVFKFQ